MCLLYNYLAQIPLNEWRETAGTQMVVSPKIQIVGYSQLVGPTKSEVKLTEDGLHICCGAHAMSYYTKREEV
jgi:hypothetical protein